MTLYMFFHKNVQYWWGYRAGDLSYIVENLNLFRHLRSQQEVYLKPKTNRGTTTSWSCSQSTHFSPSLSLCVHREYILKRLYFFFLRIRGSTNLDSCELIETEPTAREPTWTDLGLLLTCNS